VYALVVDKNGPKLVTTPEPGAIPNVTLMPSSVDARNRSIDDLAAIIMRRTDRPVVNMTGLNGSYDFKLNWTPDSSDLAPKSAVGTGQPKTSPESGSPLRALKDLGLRAERRRIPLKFLIIDYADRNSAEN
jgi:uncharacterized protein (TIGR03435 family)